MSVILTEIKIFFYFFYLILAKIFFTSNFNLILTLYKSRISGIITSSLKMQKSVINICRVNNILDTQKRMTLKRKEEMLLCTQKISKRHLFNYSH